jgi:hypothetical protein
MTEQRPAEAPMPAEGYPLPLRLPGRQVVLWWGPDEDGTDVVAVENGRLLVWDSLEACLDDARTRGLPAAVADDTAPDVLDLRPVAAWLRGEQLRLDPVTALNLWNLAGDVAASVGAPWGDEGWTADNCHAKLTAAAVPWLVDADAYVPRWSPAEMRYLRRRMLAATALLRTHLPN